MFLDGDREGGVEEMFCGRGFGDMDDMMFGQCIKFVGWVICRVLGWWSVCDFRGVGSVEGVYCVGGIGWD